MIDLKSPENIQTVLTFIVPGLIVLFVRGQFLTGRNHKHTDAILSYFTISAIYFALIFPLVAKWSEAEKMSPLLSHAIWSSLVFFGPAVLGLALGVNARKDYLRRLLRWCGLNPVHPIAPAWDWKFGDTRASYVRVVLKGGETIVGFLGEDSISSSDQNERDLYLEKIYDLQEDGEWKDVGNLGLLVKADEIRFIEFMPKEEG